MQKIKTFLWYDGKAEEAAQFYTSIFRNSRVTHASPMVVEFELDGQQFIALNGGPDFKFTEAISLFVTCESQAEVDDYWNKLISGGGSPSQCGWLKDKYGLSWQIIPKTLIELMSDKNPAKANAVTQAMLKMRKIDIAALKAAYAGA
ncbi:MAG TPA: VOC family protein [Gemmatimonadaceae bacterium]|nr:VOC family protein [Gemmatimonadaceae bacterium]